MANKSSIQLKLFRAADILCVLAVILISVILFLIAFKLFSPTASEAAILTVDANGTLSEYSLSDDASYSFQSNGITVEIHISDGQAYIFSSECADGVCRSMGKISRNGQIIVCAPAHFSMYVTSSKGGEYDAVIR